MIILFLSSKDLGQSVQITILFLSSKDLGQSVPITILFLSSKDLGQSVSGCSLLSVLHRSRLIFFLFFHKTVCCGTHWNYLGWGGSVGCAVRLETRRLRVQPPPRSATFFRGDWSWNIFYGHSLPSADSRRAVVSFWRKNVHNTG